MQTKTKKAEVNIINDAPNIRLGRPKTPAVSLGAFINNREPSARVTSWRMKVIKKPL